MYVCMASKQVLHNYSTTDTGCVLILYTVMGLDTNTVGRNRFTSMLSHTLLIVSPLTVDCCMYINFLLLAEYIRSLCILTYVRMYVCTYVVLHLDVSMCSVRVCIYVCTYVHIVCVSLHMCPMFHVQCANLHASTEGAAFRALSVSVRTAGPE